MSSWKEFMRSWVKTAPRRRGRTRPDARLSFDTLEARDVPSISVAGTPPVWQAVGPVATADAANVLLGTPDKNIDIGAVNEIAVDPFNSNRLAVGAVNGGIWITTNYPNSALTWTPTGDNLPSLAISSIAFSPSIPNVIYAGTGSYTNGGQPPFFNATVNTPGIGGASIGLYKSTDGGTTWAQVGGSTFDGVRIRDVVPTKLNGGNTIFVSTSDGGAGIAGLYRSDDGGASWQRLSGANGLPDLGVTNLIADALNPNKFYAAPVGGTGAGVYMLDATGGNTAWVNITSNLPSAATLGSRILLASTPAVTNTGVNPIYAAVVDPTGVPQGIYRAVPFGSPATYVWTKIGPGGLPPDVSKLQLGDVNFAIVADPTSDHVVYVAGDFKGTAPFAGIMARGDAIANTWTIVTAPDVPAPAPTAGTVTPTTPNPAPTTAPAPDFRNLVFVGNNTILASTDGGVYQVANPRGVSTAPVWTSINGNLQISETYQADVDDRGTPSVADDVYMAGTQGTGSAEAVFGQTWKEVLPFSNSIVRADDTNGIRYYAEATFALTRRNANGTLTVPATTVTGGGTLQGNLQFNPVLTLNQSDSNVMLVGGPNQDLYLSTDHANTFTSIGGPGFGTKVPNLTSTPATPTEITAIAFGTLQIRNAAYVATDDGNIAQSFDVTSGSGNFTLTNFKTVAGGSPAYNIVMDPNNPLTAYAVTKDHVYRTLDGQTWTDITGTLSGFVSAGGLVQINSLVLFNNNTPTTSDDLLLVGGYGGVYEYNIGQTPNNAVGPWLKFGSGIPNVLVFDLSYDALADTLVAATYGRGVYRLTNLSTALLNGPVITVTGDTSANTMTVYSDPANSRNFIVTDGLGNSQSFSLDSYRRVIFKGLAGADTIIVGSKDTATAGNTSLLSLLVSVDAGGDANDKLVISDAADTTSRQVTVAPANIGGGVGDNLFAGGGSVSFTNLNAGTEQILLGSNTADQLIFDDSTTVGADSLTVTASRITRSLGGKFDYSGAEQLSLEAGSGPTTFNLQSSNVPVSLTGGSGNDTFNIASDAPTNNGDLGALNGAIAIDGGAGNDTVNLNGTGGDDAVNFNVTDVNGGGTVTNLPVDLSFASIQNFNFDGQGGSNSANIVNSTGTAFGSPTDPGSGNVYSPTGAGAGTLRLGNVTQFGMSSLASLSFSGAGSGSGDTLLLLGTSGAGMQSAFGEAVVGDGRDVINVSDSSYQIQTITGIPLLNLSMDPTSYSNLYVASGNEGTSSGDQVTVTPSSAVNIVVDGMGPVAKPGDQLTILGAGPFTESSGVDDPSYGPLQNRFNNADGSSVGVLNFENTGLPSAGISSGMIAVGTDAGPISQVEVFDRLSHALRYTVTPFEDFSAGVSVASGDVNGDGIADLIVGAGPGGGPRVAIFNGFDGSLLSNFFAYEDTFRGGVNVSTADFNGDGYSDIVVGTGVGGGPRVRILSGKDLSVIRDVFVYASTFRGGVNVAAGDFNGDHVPDLITAAGAGGGPQVVVLSGVDLKTLASFYVFDPNSRAGFSIATGDINGDGYSDVIAGDGAGDPAHVTVFSGLTHFKIQDFYVNDPLEPGTAIPSIQFDAGVRVAAADVNGDGIDDLITAKGPGSTPTIRTYQLGVVDPATHALTPTLQEIQHFDAFGGAFSYGLYVGGSD